MPTVLCVDHGMRQGSASEAREVVRRAKAAGLPAHILKHRGERPQANVEAVARQNRYRLIGAWAKRHGVKAVCVAHTRDDQAETFLLRLARGSGLDGLSAMRAVSPYPLPEFSELRLVRPLLGTSRGSLRDYLRREGECWLDDPMNTDPRFDRVRIRNAWPSFESAGLSKARVADAAEHLARARAALEVVSQAVMVRTCRAGPDGTIAVDPAALAEAPREVGLRALAGMLMAVSGQTYRPRFERLETLFDSVCAGNLAGGRTLHGCKLGPAPASAACFGPSTVLIRREPGRVKLMKSNG